ncbi:MAG: LysR family transcriptional regulator [Oceanospirillales bacterium]|nr:LysR family transcriptional regulator [Oceanospirillales bacterium]
MTFKTIAECHSLTLAALRLHKTQAAVSIQLKKLETLTGKTLITRGYHSAELTADGGLLLQYARKLLAMSDEALHRLDSEEISGTVRFGIPDDYASAFLLRTLQRFARSFPEVRLEIRNDISQKLFGGLENGELDLALVTRRNTNAGGEVLRRDPLLWVAEEHARFDPGEPLPLALYPHGCGFRQHILDALSDAQRDYYIACECSGVAGVNIAVDSGLAIAATSAPLIRPNWRLVAQDELDLPTLDAVAIELRMSRDTPGPAVRQFAAELKTQVAGPGYSGQSVTCLMNGA